MIVFKLNEVIFLTIKKNVLLKNDAKQSYKKTIVFQLKEWFYWTKQFY